MKVFIDRGEFGSEQIENVDEIYLTGKTIEFIKSSSRTVDIFFIKEITRLKIKR